MLPGTQVWSRARTKALFDEEQRYIAPGLQTIALLSELAIERGRGAIADRFRRQGLPRSECGRVGGEPRPRAPALCRRADARSSRRSPSAASRRSRAPSWCGSSPNWRRATSGASSSSAAAPRRSKPPSVWRARTPSAPTSSASRAAFTARRPACCRSPTSPGRRPSGRCPPVYHLAPFPDPTCFAGSDAECLAHAIVGAAARDRGAGTAGVPPPSSSNRFRARPATSSRRPAFSPGFRTSRASTARCSLPTR